MRSSHTKTEVAVGVGTVVWAAAIGWSIAGGSDFAVGIASGLVIAFLLMSYARN